MLQNGEKMCIKINRSYRKPREMPRPQKLNCDVSGVTVIVRHMGKFVHHSPKVKGTKPPYTQEGGRNLMIDS